VSTRSPRHRLSPPSAFLDLHARLKEPSLAPERITEAIMELPDLAAEIMRLANSSLYGMERTIDRLDRGIALIGPAVLREVVLTMAMGRAARAMPDLGGSLSPAWMRGHLVSVARAAALVARCFNVPLEEEARTAGILHDVGLIELALRDARELRCAHDDAALAGESTLVHERARFGVDHAELGLETVESWGLPQLIVHAVACHHAPLTAPTGMRFLPSVLSVAETLVGPDADCGRSSASPEILRALEISPDEWQKIIPTLAPLVLAR